MGQEAKPLMVFLGFCYANFLIRGQLGQICTGDIHPVYSRNLYIFLKIEAFDEFDEACSYKLTVQTDVGEI